MMTSPQSAGSLESLVASLGGSNEAILAVAYMLRLPHESDVDALRAGTTVLKPEQRAQLDVALEVIATIGASPSEVWMWLQGTSIKHDSGMISPADAIRAGMFDDVRASADRLAKDVLS